MRRTTAALVIILITAAALPGFSAGLRIGVLGSGGISTATGSMLQAPADALAAMGGSSLAAPGAARARPFPAWTAGAFFEADLLPWLALRFEPRAASMGAVFFAVTDAGIAFGRYGLSFDSVMVPVLLEARLREGPGYLTGALGVFPAMVLGPIAVSATYASVTTITAIAQPLLGSLFLGASAGLGYALPLGPLEIGFEARIDAGFTSAAFGAGSGLYPISVSLLASVGFPLGGRP